MKRKYKRFLAAAAGIAFIISTLICAGAASIGTVIHESSLKIADNAEYTRIIAMHDSLGRQEANVFVVDTKGEGLKPAVMYGAKLYGRTALTSVVDYAATAEGLSISGGLNGDFYSLTTGIPLGMSVHNGRLNTSDVGYPAIGFTDDGRTIIGEPKLQILMESDTGAVIPVDHFNKYRTMYGVYLFSEDFSTESRTTTPGTHIVLDIQSGEIGIGKTVTVRVSDIMTDAGNIKMLDNALLLSVDNDGPLDKISNIAVGQTYRITFKAANDVWNDVTEAVGGGQILLADGLVLPDSTTEAAPRTAVGVTADGLLVAAEIDGRKPGHSAGVTVTETAEFMLSLGCTDALMLDGGGSSTVYLRKTGFATGEVINEVSDGVPRSNANSLLFENNVTPDGMVYRLQLYPYNIEALPNATIPLEIKAADVSYTAAAAPEPESIMFNITEGMGTINADAKSAYLTTGSSVGLGTISAEWGAAYGETALTILDSVDSIDVLSDGASIEEIDLKSGEEKTFGAKAYKNTLEVYSSNNSFTWTVSSPDVGTITQNGVFKASDKINQSGTLTVSYGDVSKTINLTVGKVVEEEKDENGDDGEENKGTPPVIDIDSMEGWNYENDFLNIGAHVTDDDALAAENITLLVDGKGTEFSYDAETGVLMAHLKNDFSKGIHKVTITASDTAGNLAQKFESFYVDREGAQSPFSDVSGHWAKDYIDYLYAAGLVRGVADEATSTLKYLPQNNITRAEFAVMLCRYLKLDTQTSDGDEVAFTDESAIPDWAKKEIHAVAKNGVMTGRPDGEDKLMFDPNARLTRAEAITAIGRLMPKEYAAADITFTDAEDIPDWAKEHVGRLIGLGVISGYSDGTLAPGRNVTRAEVAKILYTIY
ncbi:MAG: S-layer homology domain-containing protein [Clostridia bacterium]|nr:S-layer homology domain-containing protein [Clostridia bacterium]